MKISVKANGQWVVNNEKYYFGEAKDLVWNLWADDFLSMEGADAELQSIRSWVDLESFANRFGTFYIED